MEGISFLTILSGAMFFGSYIAGSVPLMFTLSESKMRVVSIFGAGLLVGTALSVIIPEGVEALYNAQNEAHNSEFHGIANPAQAQNILEAINTKNAAELPRIIPKDAELPKGMEKVKREAEQTNDTVRRKRSSEGDDHHHEHGHGNHLTSDGIHRKIGYSLVIGFVFMLLVDQISSCTVSRGDRSGRGRLGVSATIGLVVHAAADGIALGCASTINKSEVQLIVFIAIMLHKAPAAFGLVSFLMLEGIDHRTIRKHLLVFSLSAPFGAIATFLIIQNSGDQLSSSEANTGVLMLFSAGTFLYVATVHVLPELSKSSHDYSLVVDVQSPASAGHSHAGGANFTIKELCSIIIGALVPAVLASGHSH